jgi:hypothetical protein
MDDLFDFERDKRQQHHTSTKDKRSERVREREREEIERELERREKDREVTWREDAWRHGGREGEGGDVIWGEEAWYGGDEEEEREEMKVKEKGDIFSRVCTPDKKEWYHSPSRGDEEDGEAWREDTWFRGGEEEEREEMKAKKKGEISSYDKLLGGLEGRITQTLMSERLLTGGKSKGSFNLYISSLFHYNLIL